MMTIIRVLFLLFALVALGPSHAQTYPAKSVRIIIPFAPGGANDVVFRMLTPGMTSELGQSVLIDNRPGGAATIGTELIARAPADGYTLGVANVSLAVNPFIMARLPYDAEKDFAPISLVGVVTMVLAVHPSVPVRSVKEFIAFTKARPGQLNYASGGNASSGHLAAELFLHTTGLRMIHIPFKGGGPAVASSIGGETAILFTSVPAAVPYFRSGRLVALGVTSATRDPALPDVPSIAEAGVPGYEFFDWIGLVTPAGTPPAVISRVNAALVKVLADAEIRKRIAGVGARAVGSPPDELGALIRRELARWSKVVKATGIKAD